jgi:conjugative transfer signal peptidase TraF
MAVLAAGLCVVSMAWTPRPLLVWNVTASAPIGLYRQASVAVARGDWALVRTPSGVADFAAQRRYLPSNVPMIKRVVGVTGDRICRLGNAVSVNGKASAIAQEHDGQGRALPVWSGCQRLADGAVFLLNAPPTSFDSRYFGAVQGSNVIEKLEPVWTF